VSAAVLAPLVVVQAGRVLGPTASAEMVSHAGNYTALTADSGTEDVLLVLDGRKELLLVYRMENQSALELYKRYELPRLFQDARGAAPGRK
jgi:hypothetical protein